VDPNKDGSSIWFYWSFTLQDVYKLENELQWNIDWVTQKAREFYAEKLQEA
jgi:hypothetical protein